MQTNRWKQILSISVIGLTATLFGGCSDDTTDASTDNDASVSDDATPSTAVWKLLGDQVSPGNSEAEDPTMMVVDDTPVVGYRYGSFLSYLHQWDGSSWGESELDPTGGQTGPSLYRSPDFCTDGSQVFMAYTHIGDSEADDDTFYDRIFLYRWTSTDGWSVQNDGDEVSQTWDAVEGIGYDADEPTVACRSGMDPAVAWFEVDLSAEEDADVFVSTGPHEISPRNNRVTEAGTDNRVVDVALGADGTAYIAQFELATDATFTTNLYVTQYANGTLTSLGGIIDSDTDTNNLSAPSLAIDGNTPYIAWSADRDGDGNRQIYVARWNGSEWEPLPGPVSALNDAVDAGNPDLHIIDGIVTIAWDEANDDGHYIFVAELLDNQWEIIGNQLNVEIAREALDPSLGVAVDGTLYVAFEEFVDGWAQIFVKYRTTEDL